MPDARVRVKVVGVRREAKATVEGSVSIAFALEMPECRT